MFSAAVELLLNVAWREATARRHTHLTIEHLLYVLAHDAEAEKILSACGADLPRLRSMLDKYLQDHVEQFRRGDQKDPEQTLGFRRLLQTAVLHVQSSGKDEVDAGDLLAAMLQQPKSYAIEVLQAQGITRLDILNYVSHGIAKPGVPTGDLPSDDDHRPAPGGMGEEGGSTARDPLGAYAVSLTAKARNSLLDPLIGRAVELQRTLEILCRRRKNNPVFVGDPGVGKTAMAEGLAMRLLQDDVPVLLKDAEVFSLDTTALLAGTRFRGDFEERFKAVINALAKRPRPILFIDEIHSTVGAGATTGGTLDLATLIKPVLSAGELRVVGLDDLRGVQARREGPRAGAAAAEGRHRGAERRGGRAHPRGTALAIRGPPPRDLHRRRARWRREARQAAPARCAAARLGHRPARRGRRDGASCGIGAGGGRDIDADGRSRCRGGDRVSRG